MGKGVESEEAVGNTLEVEDAWTGVSGGLRLSDSSKPSGSSSMRLMIAVDEKLSNDPLASKVDSRKFSQYGELNGATVSTSNSPV